MTEETGSLPDWQRRRLLAAGGISALASAFPALAVEPATASTSGPGSSAGAYLLPELPYPASALAPKISAETVALHHGKHHRSYVDKLNGLLAQDSRRGKPLEELMRATHEVAADIAIFNNAAQTWNHTFYWQSLTPTDGGGTPGGAIARAIDRDFGGYSALRGKLAEAANSQFGSGWAWLVLRDGKLAVEKTGDAGNPLLQGARPLLTIDVWEHAYYVDYRNRRADYVAAVIDGLLNWRFADENLGKA